MAPNTGTYDISTLLKARFQSVAQFGMDTVQQVLAADIAAHNAIVQQLIQDLTSMSTDRQRIYGTSADGDMIEVDEYGRAPTQVARPGSTTGYPLRLFQYPIGWTEKWLQIKTPADMAMATQSAEKAHLRAIQREIKRAIYGSANFTWRDHLIDNVDLNVKRFVNADGAGIAQGPNGETFDGATHTHYLASATLTAAALISAVQTVVEHGFGTKPEININRADEAAVRALTGFVPYVDPRIVYHNYTVDAPGTPLDISRLDNRAIGIFNAAEVWVKPWALANYAFVYDDMNPQKPLVFRQRTQQTLQGLRIAATIEAYPLTAQYMEAEFGLGVWTRTNGAVLEFDNAVYQNPVIS
jgi:hypothetical protein